jgi:hypothetical protein
MLEKHFRELEKKVALLETVFAKIFSLHSPNKLSKDGFPFKSLAKKYFSLHNK